MKKYRILLACIFILLYTFNGVKAASPQSSAKAAILMDSTSKRVLWGKNIHSKLPMASTTKIMTALVAIEEGNLQDIVTVSPKASGIEGSSIWLSPHEKQTLENLLYGLMLRSGNDAAAAIAIHVGGSLESFVDMMNQKAQRIGAINTHFENPHGLHHDDHYTTAYDLALIASYALENEDFKRIVSTKYKTIPWQGQPWDRSMQNKNKLLWQYEGANGVKTGYTQKAGRCLVASSSRNDIQLVSVVLNCGPMFEECVELMDYGFETYKNYKIYNENELLAMIPVVKGNAREVPLVVGESFSLVLTDAERNLISFSIVKPPVLKAPVEKDMQYGYVKIYLENTFIKQIPLIAAHSIDEKSFINNLQYILSRWVYQEDS